MDSFDPPKRGPDVMRVTVLMTLYNKGAFVRDAIQSVLASTLTDLELLVVDDASTDDGLEIVRSFHDPRIRILESTQNTGRAAAANRGWDSARGDFIAVLDADDSMHPERLARQVAFLEDHDDVGVCGSWLQEFGTSDQIAKRPSEDPEIRAGSLFGLPLAYNACMVRRSLLRERGIRCDPSWKTPGMDHLFLVSIGMYSHYANIPEVLTYYRIGEQNMAHGRDRTMDRFLLLRETFRQLDIPVTDEEMSLHLMLGNMHTVPPTSDRVRALARWMNKLKMMNRDKGLFPIALFERDLDERWDRLFFPLANRAPGSAWTYTRMTGAWSAARVRYLLQASLRGPRRP